MKLEIKKRLIEALRSGTYKQASGALRVNDCFCALGVLCDIYLKDINRTFKFWKWVSWKKSDGAILSIKGEFSIPPLEVMKWAGFSTRHPKFVSQIMKLNDSDKKSFNEIADFIESYDFENNGSIKSSNKIVSA